MIDLIGIGTEQEKRKRKTDNFKNIISYNTRRKLNKIKIQPSDSKNFSDTQIHYILNFSKQPLANTIQQAKEKQFHSFIIQSINDGQIAKKNLLNNNKSMMEYCYQQPNDYEKEKASITYNMTKKNSFHWPNSDFPGRINSRTALQQTQPDPKLRNVENLRDQLQPSPKQKTTIKDIMEDAIQVTLQRECRLFCSRGTISPDDRNNNFNNQTVNYQTSQNQKLSESRYQNVQQNKNNEIDLEEYVNGEIEIHDFSQFQDNSIFYDQVSLPIVREFKSKSAMEIRNDVPVERIEYDANNFGQDIFVDHLMMTKNRFTRNIEKTKKVYEQLDTQNHVIEKKLKQRFNFSSKVLENKNQIAQQQLDKIFNQLQNDSPSFGIEKGNGKIPSYSNQKKFSTIDNPGHFQQRKLDGLIKDKFEDIIRSKSVYQCNLQKDINYNFVKSSNTLKNAEFRKRILLKQSKLGSTNEMK